MKYKGRCLLLTNSVINICNIMSYNANIKMNYTKFTHSRDFLQNWIKRLLDPSCLLQVRTEQLGSHCEFTGILRFEYFSRILPENSTFIKNDNNDNTGTLHEDRRSFMIISGLVFIRMRNSSNRTCRGNQTQILYSVTFFENLVVYGLWVNVENYGTIRQPTSDCTVWRRRIAF